ncbi:MAG: 4'-phosphopantetheinyl transferase family protein [Spirochaetales bacterium]
MKARNAKSSSEKYARKILGSYLKVDGYGLRIERNEYGKPFLKDYVNVYFNISHTKEAIVCALADHSIGVDIEKIRPIDLRVVEHFFAKKEKDYIFSNSTNVDFRFTEIWTKKEAYLKWLGVGIIIPFKKFNVLELLENGAIIDSRNVDNFIISTCFLSLQVSERIQLLNKTFNFN